MSTYTATIHWNNTGPDFVGNKYSREHRWEFDGGVIVKASASPHIVPMPWANPDHVDPEEAFVASLSSCHMLFFLSLAARQGYRLDSYTDQASGVMEKDAAGKMVITTVTLSPLAVFNGDKVPERETIEKLHHQAHELCFLANSVRSEILIQPVYPSE
jgi:organic hydroperoxide reductase OsmC/OhrA